MVPSLQWLSGEDLELEVGAQFLSFYFCSWLAKFFRVRQELGP